MSDASSAMERVTRFEVLKTRRRRRSPDDGELVEAPSGMQAAFEDDEGYQERQNR